MAPILNRIFTRIKQHSNDSGRTHVRGVKHIPFVFTCLVLSIYLYVFLEWLFFITKPSFASGTGGWHLFLLLLISPLPFIVMALIGQFCLELLAFIVSLFRQKKRQLPAFSIVLPALVTTALFFILFDNFTYTLFRKGVVTTERNILNAYAFLLLVTVLLSSRWFYRKLRNTQAASFKRAQLLATGLIVLSILATLVQVSSNWDADLEVADHSDLVTGKQLPNILFLSADGLSANHLSVYGYKRDTTPFLRELLPQAMLFENTFSNSSTTYSSLLTVLNGKTPTEHRAVFSFGLLRRQHAYKHLPGILRKLGYHNYQLSVRRYADAIDAGMLLGFDWANGRRPAATNWLFKTMIDIAPSLYLEKYFSGRVLERILERTLHVTGISEMEHSFAIVTNVAENITSEGSRDKDRIDNALNLIDGTAGPWFMHIHLMGTHCCEYSPEKQVFSQGAGAQTDENRQDFYDDTILDADNHIRTLVTGLSERGLMDNTMVVIFSDHSQAWKTNERIPLLILFPERKIRGNVRENVQLADIVPTVLDVLDVPPRHWLHGHSLSSTERPKPVRPIFSTAGTHSKLLDTTEWITELGPPFYGMTATSVLFCDKWFHLDLKTGELSSGVVADHTAPCLSSQLPTENEAKQVLFEHLQLNGFDTSKIGN